MIITDLKIDLFHWRTEAWKTGVGTAFGNDQQLGIVTISTDEGISGNAFLGSSRMGADHFTKGIIEFLKPRLIGHNPQDIGKIWWDMWKQNRSVSTYSIGAIDICLWDINGKITGQPIHRLLGTCKDSVPAYSSTAYHETKEEYAEEALHFKNLGWKAHKIHPHGNPQYDVEISKAVREAVGDETKLMLDSMWAYRYEDSLRVGRAIEELNYYWYEEPLFDENFHGLRELTRILDIPIVGTEVLAHHPYSVAECISSRVVDMVRADVSWSGGITATMKTAHLAESFGVQCEIHTAIYHPLELVNLHCCAAIKNSEFFEVLVPYEYFNFGLKDPIKIIDGKAQLPKGQGLGIDLDWDFIDNSTFKKF